MLAYRFHQTLFTRVITATSATEAERIAISGTARSSAIVEIWHTPDVWTRRAIDMATSPGVIDTIPRFVLDSDDGPFYVDIDNVYPTSSQEARIKWRKDSAIHHEWLRACIAEHERKRNNVLHNYITGVATERDSNRYALLARALAGAWGLGPIPEWHAAILPALIALDIESSSRGYTFADNVFELDRDDLWQHLHAQLPDGDDDIDHLVELIARGTILSLREYTLRALVSLGWIR